MGRNSKRVALYEVINKARNKPVELKKPVGKKSEPVIDKKPKEENASAWSAKPKIVRKYNDRIEFCFSWPLFGILILVFIAVLLVFYRLGQSSMKETVVAVEKVTSTEQIKPVIPQVPKPKPSVRRTVVPAKMVQPMGDNVIVIASYGISSHLEPVKEYFGKYGIDTDILDIGDRYLLITRDRFDNPAKKGTDGFKIREKIIAIGASYKPPQGSGFESFGKTPFHDAYGMKLK